MRNDGERSPPNGSAEVGPETTGVLDGEQSHVPPHTPGRFAPLDAQLCHALEPTKELAELFMPEPAQQTAPHRHLTIIRATFTCTFRPAHHPPVHSQARTAQARHLHPPLCAERRNHRPYHQFQCQHPPIGWYLSANQLMQLAISVGILCYRLLCCLLPHNFHWKLRLFLCWNLFGKSAAESLPSESLPPGSLAPE